MYRGKHRTPALRHRLGSPLTAVTTLACAVGVFTMAATPPVVTAPSPVVSAALADREAQPYLPAFGTDVGMYAIAEVTRSLAWDATHAVTIPYIEGPDGTLHMRCAVTEGDDYSVATCSDGWSEVS